MKKNSNVLITGSAGFIGFHVCLKLLEEDINLIGFDNINSYYETKIKNDRLKKLELKGKKNKNWKFIKGDLENIDFLLEIFNNYKPDTVIHLAAQAGVRYSIVNPKVYINSNLIGFSNVLECCRINEIKILYMLAVAQFMEEIQNCPSPKITKLIIQLACMQLQKIKRNYGT